MMRSFRGIAFALLVALACAPDSLSSQTAGSVVEVKSSRGGGKVPQAWYYPTGSTSEGTLVSDSRPVSYGDRFEVLAPWVVRLDLYYSTDGSRGTVAVSADARTESQQLALGPDAGDSRASVSIIESFLGTRVKVGRGSLVLESFPVEACVEASGACVVNLGTAYALRVDDSAQAYLAVTEDSVAVSWWAGTDERDPAGDCATTSPTTPCRQLAAPGEVWTWSVTEPPWRWDNENQALLGFPTLGAMYAAIDDAVDFNGNDIWDDSIFKKPLFWVTTGAVLGGVACIIWCGGDDVTGTVIINP